MSIRKTRKQIHFPAKQRWAITIILLMILSVIFYGELSTYNHINNSYDHEEHEEILVALKFRRDDKAENFKSTQKYKPAKISPVVFNPNTVTTEELVSMGIPKKDAKSWTKYTSKGGKFYKPEDLKRLYSMNDALYEQLKDYVDIPKKKWRNKKQFRNDSTYNSSRDNQGSRFAKFPDNEGQYQNVKSTIDSTRARIQEEKENAERIAYNEKFKSERKKRSSGIAEDYIIAINETDSTELQVLDGIGPVLSARIIKYRDQLGGFHNQNQLLEIYGVKPALVSKIVPNISFDGEMQKIDLNTIEVKELVKHPYFDYATANIFINYRSHHGDFKSVKDVKKIRIIKDYWLEEAEPYFSYEPSY